MASHVNNRAKAHGKSWRKINWASDDVRATPITSRYTPDPDDDTMGPVRPYAPGGGFAYDVDVGGRSVQANNGSDMMHHLASDILIAGCGSDLAGIQIWKELVVGSDANNTTITWVEFSSVVNPGGADLTPEFPGRRVFNGT